MTKLETMDELKAICLFHMVGFALEAFKTSSGIKAWSYPDFAYTKLFGVPLFSGFMYAAVGSYIIQAWRLFDLRIRHHPPYWMATIIAVTIYANFFTHHFIGDYRWYIAMCSLGLYARAVVIYRPLDRDRTMPLLLAFVLIGFFIWLAENISTFFGIWRYPNQLGAWSAVHLGKWSSWSLLVIMTFTIVANLKHFKARVHVPSVISCIASRVDRAVSKRYLNFYNPKIHNRYCRNVIYTLHHKTSKPIILCQINPKLKVYYNSACPVCKAGIEGQMEKESRCEIQWNDVHQKNALVSDLNSDLESVRERLHVIDENGQIQIGFDAFLSNLASFA